MRNGRAVIVVDPDLCLWLSGAPRRASAVGARSRAGTPHPGRPRVPARRSCLTPRKPLKRSSSASSSRGRARAGGIRRWRRARRNATAGGPGRRRCADEWSPRRPSITSTSRLSRPRIPLATRRGASGCPVALKMSSSGIWWIAVRGSASTPWIHAAGRSTTTACGGMTSEAACTRSAKESGTWEATKTPRTSGRSSPLTTSRCRSGCGHASLSASAAVNGRSIGRGADPAEDVRVPGTTKAVRCTAPRCPNPPPASYVIHRPARRRERSARSASKTRAKCPVSAQTRGSARSAPCRRERSARSARCSASEVPGQKMISPALRRLRRRATASSRMSAASVSLRRSFT